MTTLYMPLFRSCTNLRSLTQLHAYLLVAGLHRDPLPSTKLIESYAQMGSFRSSKLVFKNFPNPDSFMWGVLIKCSVWNNLFQEAIFLYETMMKNNQAQISSFIFPSVLRACSGFGDLGTGGMVHGTVIKYGLDEDSVIQTSLLCMYGDMGCLSCAKKMFDEMPIRDLVSWSSIILSYVENGEASEGLEMFRLMVLEGIKPDWVTMLSVAEACGELGLLKLARLVHGYIVNRKIESDGSLANSLVTMYSKCGDLGSAQRIFLNVTNRSTTLWTAMISSYNRSGRFIDGIEVFVDMLDARVEPNAVTMMTVLGCYAGLGWLREGKLVHCYIIRKEMDPEYSVLGPALIELYAECGKLNYSEKVLHGVAGRNIVPWNMLISIYSQKGLLTEALVLFVQMQTRGLMPDSFSLASSLSACADGSLLQFGDQIHGHIITRGLSDKFVQNSLIDMYSKCGLTELAYMIFDKIKEKSVIAWNSMICGFSQNGNSVEAISLFDQMYLNGLEMNDVTFLSVLQACSNLGYLEKGKWLHHKLLTYGVRTNLYIDTALTDMYAKCGDLRTAQRVFDNMSNKSVVSWSVMIAGYGAHGRVNAAISLFNQMVESSVRPNHVTFMNILSACSHAGSMEDGKSYFNSMRDFGVEPNSEHYACMVDLLSRGGDLNEAYRIINSMSFPADASIWSALLNGCRIHHRMDMIKTIEKDLLDINTDDTGYYTLLSNIYGEEGNWKEFGKVRSAMKGIGLRKVPGYSTIELDKRVYRFSVGDTSLLQTEESLSFLENFQNLAQEYVCNLENSNLKLDSVMISKGIYSQQEVSNCTWNNQITVDNYTSHLIDLCIL
ncbi:putative pentatricopeptide repeat-containing protein At1g69350, mitochondrial [Herrania umbratica]|uniref:Pentatricopeptide repeat-containing protein At1g69350, mitochondrial n=1 Tax=Herrania umbratica TaxID=108875 RepID=A0A6J1BL08_9ROSI|nr:putative pentatricopeptide repeat-containing protein At1g69350, mitochondrial [Herrania umbratica]